MPAGDHIEEEAGATRRTLLGTALGIGAALVATATVFAIGNLGAPIRVVTGWSPNGADLTLVEVAVTAATAVAMGGALLWWMERRWARSWHTWERIAATTAVVSALPLLRLDIDAGSKVSLVCMHLLTGACAIAGQRGVRAAERDRDRGGRASSHFNGQS